MVNPRQETIDEWVSADEGGMKVLSTKGRHVCDVPGVTRFFPRLAYREDVVAGTKIAGSDMEVLR